MRKLYCPYCNHGTDSREDMHDHLTYYHWLSVPAVDQIMKELEKKLDKKTKLTARLMRGLAVVLLLIVILYYVWMIV